jgi:hypothetical protein
MNAVMETTQQGSHTSEKLIRLVIMSFAGIFFYQLITGFWLLESNLRDFSISNLGTYLFLLPFVIAPFAAYHFWRKRTLGWQLLAVYLTYSIVQVLAIVMDKVIFVSGEVGAQVFPRTSAAAYIILLFMLCSLLFVICKQRIRYAMNVDRTRMYAAVAITAYLSAFLAILS